MKKVLFCLQILLKSILIFSIVFIWLRFFLSSIWLSGLIAFGVTLILEFASFFLQKRKNNKTSLKLKEKTDAENMFLSLASHKDPLTFFLNLAKTRHANSVKEKENILISHASRNVVLFPFLKVKSLTQDDILTISKIVAKRKVERIVVLCNNYEKDCLSFVKNFNTSILILDKYETYSLLYREYDFYPEITLENKQENKLKIKDLIAFSFNKARTKGYVLSALILILPSLFIRQNLYYCIVGSILLIFALISFINPKFNNKKNQTIL